MPHLLWNQWSNLWQLYSKVTFDGENRKIIINPGETQISVKRDIYSGWKLWLLQNDNMAFPEAIRVVGGDPISPTLLTGDIYFLMNGWQIVVEDQVNFEGAIYHDDNIDVFNITPGGGVISTVSQLVQTVNISGGGSCPDVNQIATAIRQELSAELSHIDVDISSRASQSSLDDLQTEISNSFNTVVGLLNILDSKIDIVSDQVQLIDVDLTQMLTILGELKKFNFNRSRIDPIDKTLTIYDDDDITPIVIFNLLDTTGTPSVEEVAEKVPQ